MWGMSTVREREWDRWLDGALLPGRRDAAVVLDTSYEASCNKFHITDCSKQNVTHDKTT